MPWQREERDWNDPKYKAWRNKVFGRDRFACRWCGGKGKLEAHHIKKWASYPNLRYILANGITLCKSCHNKVWGCEEEYETLLSSLVNQMTKDDRILFLMMKYGQVPGKEGHP